MNQVSLFDPDIIEINRNVSCVYSAFTSNTLSAQTDVDSEIRGRGGLGRAISIKNLSSHKFLKWNYFAPDMYIIIHKTINLHKIARLSRKNNQIKSHKETAYTESTKSYQKNCSTNYKNVGKVSLYFPLLLFLLLEEITELPAFGAWCSYGNNCL